MSERLEGHVPPQEHKEQKEVPRHVAVLEHLAMAFGGSSQFSDKTVGEALIGQINNNGLNFGPEQLNEVVDAICVRWEDQDPDSDKIRADIIEGMKQGAQDWPREGNEHVWSVIDSVEKK